MTEASTRVNIDDLVAGMVLAEDAVHLNGRVLLSEGTCLTDKHLKVFRTWGLTEAIIRGGDGEELGKKAMQHLDAIVVMQAEQFMKERFTHMDMEYAPVDELFRICTREYAEKLARGGHDHNG